MSNYTDPEAVNSTVINHSTSHSLPEPDFTTVSDRSRTLIILYMKHLLPIDT